MGEHGTMNEKIASGAVEAAEGEERDYGIWIWASLGVLLVIMIGALYYATQRAASPAISTVRLKHILIRFAKDDPVDRQRALDLITELRQRIERGESFDALAREYSQDTSSASKGGDLGFVLRGTLEKTIEEYVWSAEVGALSPVLETSYGFHLVVVTSRHLSPADAYELDLERRAKERGATETPTPRAP
jgi:parvulin-like peptidyl-prolyl isomerase